MTDPIADLLTRIRNAYMVKKSATSAPYSRFKEEILKILKKEGYIKDYKVIKSKDKKNSFQIDLRYVGGMSVVTGIERLSKPGRRLYSHSKNLTPILSGKGITIISSSHGLFTDSAARKKHLGGELICKVW